MGFEGKRQRWRVRLRDEAGHILGAGTMLDEWHVLTCAHVVEEAGKPIRVTVEFVGVAGASPGHANVVDDGWIPKKDDGRGDIALLRLEKPQRGVYAAPLHRMPLADHQLVRAHGFPIGADDGLWTAATLLGEGGPGCEWIQLLRVAEADPIDRGFSGTAVLDDATDHVVGIVVGRTTENTAWMIPVETVLGYLPRLREGAEGSPALDESFARPTGKVDAPVARWLADWFTHTGQGGVEVLVTGGDDTETAHALRLGVTLADRERSLGVPSLPAGVGQPPPVGSVDLAIDASARTAEYVRRRMEERLKPDASGATVVVDRIDDSAEPDVLITKVLKPMAERAEELGIRLLLGFCRAPTLPWTPSRPGKGDLEHRLDLLDKDIAELAAIEEHQFAVATRFSGVAMLPSRAKRLRAAVGQLRSAAADGDEAWAGRHLGRCEDSAAPALAAARRLRAELDHLLDRRKELRARLDGYVEMARHHDLLDDAVLDGHRLTAWTALYEGPCALAAAETAVDEYAGAIRARIEGRA